MKTDIQIAQAAVMQPIGEIAGKLGLKDEDIELYGKYKAKISLDVLKRSVHAKCGKLILVTAITPTPAGEGKSTTTVGVGQALAKLGKEVAIALREPSLGPCFGIKGGAAGGGYSQVVPMEDINLHFTGDMHAITAAHNLLAALLDNHIHQGNHLRIDTRKIIFRRVMDMNERALRNIVLGLGGAANGVPRESGFDITVASEVMACFCLCESLPDLKQRLASIVVAYDFDGNPVKAADLKAQGAMALLLKDAIKPNIVQTLENVPAFIHGGPFANIAHGCNSVIATKMALSLADYVVTEAGFGADLGAEKFFDIKCRQAELSPSATIIVATVRALKMHGGVAKHELSAPNLAAVKKGMENLTKQIENVRFFGTPVVVAVNRFPTDTEEEMRAVFDCCSAMGVRSAMSEVFTQGGEGGIQVARAVLEAIGSAACELKHPYELEDSIIDKVEKLASAIYGADGVVFEKKALNQIKEIEALGYKELPICMAKTQYSLSDDPTLLGRPVGFKLKVREAKLCAGAGFVVVYAGDIMTMPGLPSRPAAEAMDIDENGIITGLF